jgi:hypothetical protein
LSKLIFSIIYYKYDIVIVLYLIFRKEESSMKMIVDRVNLVSLETERLWTLDYVGEDPVIMNDSANELYRQLVGEEAKPENLYVNWEELEISEHIKRIRGKEGTPGIILKRDKTPDSVIRFMFEEAPY